MLLNSQKFISIRAFVETGLYAAPGLNANEADAVPPLMATHIIREAFVTFVMKMTQSAR